MQSQMFGFYLREGELVKADLYGFTTNGIPGIEIKADKLLARPLKEKFIFLSRQRNLKLPMKKYILCIEGLEQGGGKKKKDFGVLELPLLIMFWYLAGKIPIHCLWDCVACGKVSIHGKIDFYPISEYSLVLLDEEMKKLNNPGIKIISYYQDLSSAFFTIPIEDLLKDIPGMRFDQYSDRKEKNKWKIQKIN